ncbi:hypothetical protein MRP92_00730 [Flavobacterium covae]|uniref:hypothetical protein n=1 Tax=Flavobacterium covae TaxID=2906076 RepID=UPI001FB690DF|nr:hypothetical protein [Flavobacterium covae]MCJ1805440.1 hypothetical protein [Flavobacterium covae]
MVTIKTLTKQKYKNNSKSPSKVVFFQTEKDICKIVCLHLTETVEENIEVLKQFQYLKTAEVYEVENEKGILYLLKSE